MDYEKLKVFISEHKPQLVTFFACGIMFIVGFGTGRAFGHSHSMVSDSSQQSNYSANQSIKPDIKEESTATGIIKPKDEVSVTAQAGETKPPVVDNKPVAGQPCVIKGNISGTSKIYHVKGGASYEKTTPEACFNTEAEAVAAGFRKAKR